MKKVALIVLLLFFFSVATAEAYSFQFLGAPRDTGSLTGNVGDPLLIEARSPNIPSGITMTLRVTGPSRYHYTAQMVVQDEGYFSHQFETLGLQEGRYRFEVHSSPDYPLGGMRNWFELSLVDRSLFLRMLSPLQQEYDGWLSVNGMIDEHGAAGVELTVTGPSGNYFGPRYIATDPMGRFYQSVQIDRAGTYTATIADRRGTIGIVTFNVFHEEKTPVPTPISPPSEAVKSASAYASRDSPAHFVVQTGTGPVTLSTSVGIDWVLEYIDESGTLHVVHEAGSDKAERVTFTGSGGRVYVRAYPDGTDEGRFHLYGQNVVSLTSSTAPADRFPELRPPEHTPAEESPAPVLLPLLALAVLIGFRASRP
ncbi:MAG: hypothetical protein D5R99_09235 [Methanocalculus sp. MSAO_Arc1]|uniref:hypothetical protein n=1 Tax=Methanocalculus TaxID=71151 RepID=UPI000FF591A4|nr:MULTISPECIES: hypothetical protein [unclassified Methanocalculus]MCP1662846.1 hypothetical protein [Methanocalculus sp. AMF5]RQD78992.1 MAG: hypothetical protein D5R99_09235 [Methanocalculus sp. MSAO_Arc1]